MAACHPLRSNTLQAQPVLLLPDELSPRQLWGMPYGSPCAPPPPRHAPTTHPQPGTNALLPCTLSSPLLMRCSSCGEQWPLSNACSTHPHTRSHTRQKGSKSAQRRQHSAGGAALDTTRSDQGCGWASPNQHSIGAHLSFLQPTRPYVCPALVIGLPVHCVLLFLPCCW